MGKSVKRSRMPFINYWEGKKYRKESYFWQSTKVGVKYFFCEHVRKIPRTSKNGFRGHRKNLFFLNYFSICISKKFYFERKNLNITKSFQNTYFLVAFLHNCLVKKIRNYLICGQDVFKSIFILLTPSLRFLQ